MAANSVLLPKARPGLTNDVITIAAMFVLRPMSVHPSENWKSRSLHSSTKFLQLGPVTWSFGRYGYHESFEFRLLLVLPLASLFIKTLAAMSNRKFALTVSKDPYHGVREL